MSALGDIIEAALAKPRNLSARQIETLVAVEDPAEIRAVREAAYALKVRHCGKTVSMRGLVEQGNVCAKDCLYCGIRKSNAAVRRYSLPYEEVLRAAEEAARLDYGSIVLQSGEIESEEHTRFVEKCLRGMQALPGGPFGITLSLGEQEDGVYRRWKAAGASRYLLRIETSNRELYAAMHPEGHSWERRRRCLDVLRACGYQTGTGVMSGLPGQTARDLAADVEFFAECDADMIGMGPFIPHRETPMGAGAAVTPEFKARQLRTGLNMISATRLFLHDVNIAATTALQTLAPDGREQGVLAGANVMMPNVTDVKWRKDYALYEGKPCTDENAAMCRGCLERRLAAIGETVNYGKRGDSAHFFARCAAAGTRA